MSVMYPDGYRETEGKKPLLKKIKHGLVNYILNIHFRIRSPTREIEGDGKLDKFI